jgi:hypothetical protein
MAQPTASSQIGKLDTFNADSGKQKSLVLYVVKRTISGVMYPG